MSALLLAAVPATAAFPATATTIKLTNGVEMPQMALGTWQYDNDKAADAIKKGFAAGFVHIDTAQSYKNQVGVGKALAQSGKKRDEYFLTTKTLPCSSSGYDACRKQAESDINLDLKNLGLDQVDLILLHGPSHMGRGKCDANACDKDRGQWAAYEAAYKAGKARALGVSNYCVSCLECLLSNATVMPTVNQIELHVGMGADPAGLVSYNAKHGIVSQAYSPLGNGKLPGDATLTKMGNSYGKTAAQVALKWGVQHGWSVATKADDATYLAQDIDMYSWNLTAADMQALDSNTAHPDNPSWACTA
jgi:diketogulonate reductase-like aldo/keto reductase